MAVLLKQANDCRMYTELYKQSRMSLCVCVKSLVSLYTIAFKWKKSQNSAIMAAKL